MNSAMNKERSERALGYLVIALGFSIPISSALDNWLLAGILILWVYCSKYRPFWQLVRSCPVVQVALALSTWRLASTLYSEGSLAAIVASIHNSLLLVWIPVLITILQSDRIRKAAFAAFLTAMAATLILSYALALGMIEPQSWLKGTAAEPVVFKFRITQNFLMAYAAFALLVLARFADLKRIRVLLLACAGAAAFNVLFMIGGKTGHLVLIALLVFFFLSVFGRKGFIPAVAFVAIIASIAWINTGSILHIRTAEMIRQLQHWEPGKAHAGSVDIRLQHYRNTLDIIVEHPVLGVGSGGFPAAYAKVIAGTTMPPSRNPHNEYLLIAAEFGIIGLAIFVALFVTLWRVAATLPTDQDRLLARGLTISFALASTVTSTLIDHVEGLVFCYLTALLYSRQCTNAGTGSHALAKVETESIGTSARP